LVNITGPKFVAVAFGTNPEGVIFYLADHVDNLRLPDPSASGVLTVDPSGP
jgi:hypothetical protein